MKDWSCRQKGVLGVFFTMLTVGMVLAIVCFATSSTGQSSIDLGISGIVLGGVGFVGTLSSGAYNCHNAESVETIPPPKKEFVWKSLGWKDNAPLTENEWRNEDDATEEAIRRSTIKPKKVRSYNKWKPFLYIAILATLMFGVTLVFGIYGILAASAVVAAGSRLLPNPDPTLDPPSGLDELLDPQTAPEPIEHFPTNRSIDEVFNDIKGYYQEEGTLMPRETLHRINNELYDILGKSEDVDFAAYETLAKEIENTTNPVGVSDIFSRDVVNESLTVPETNFVENATLLRWQDKLYEYADGELFGGRRRRLFTLERLLESIRSHKLKKT